MRRTRFKHSLYSGNIEDILATRQIYGPHNKLTPVTVNEGQGHWTGNGQIDLWSDYLYSELDQMSIASILSEIIIHL